VPVASGHESSTEVGPVEVADSVASEGQSYEPSCTNEGPCRSPFLAPLGALPSEPLEQPLRQTTHQFIQCIGTARAGTC
jgi:hypothetical protein